MGEKINKQNKIKYSKDKKVFCSNSEKLQLIFSILKTLESVRFFFLDYGCDCRRLYKVTNQPLVRKVAFS